jgi:hypothetical protein
MAKYINKAKPSASSNFRKKKKKKKKWAVSHWGNANNFRANLGFRRI